MKSVWYNSSASQAGIHKLKTKLSKRDYILERRTTYLIIQSFNDVLTEIRELLDSFMLVTRILWTLKGRQEIIASTTFYDR